MNSSSVEGVEVLAEAVERLGLDHRAFPAKRAQDAAKRCFDVAIALSLFSFLLPVMIGVWALVRITSRGPAIYSQKRLTNKGRVFTMYKFRTMNTCAELQTGAVLAAKSDSRVTPIGAFLRKSRLDELPQLLNVLLGDMSLIGPRPERPEIAKTLIRELPDMARRLEVKAGITGLAQVQSGYAACLESYREKLAWDITYIENRSLALDFQIAYRTIWVIFTGFGAR